MPYPGELILTPALKDIRDGVTAILPACIAMIPFALLLGQQAAVKGFTPLDMLAMSSIVFAGSSQILAVSLWTTPPAVSALVVAVFLINLRYMLMSASISRQLARFGAFRKFAAAYLLTDEVWAIAERRALTEPVTPSYWFAAGISLFLNWQFWTVIGSIFGGMVPEPELFGFDFAFPAIFIVLALGFWKGWRTAPVIAAAAIAAVIAEATLPGAWYVIIGAFAGILAAVITAPAEEATP